MDILHWKIGRVGIDILWVNIQSFFLLPTIIIGKTPLVRYTDVRFLYLLITFYFKHSK